MSKKLADLIYSNQTSAALTELENEEIQRNINHQFEYDPDYFPATSLYIACLGGNENVVKKLLDISRIDVNKSYSWSDTPLYAATQRHHISVVHQLLQKKKILCKANILGETLLHEVAGWGYDDILSLFLKRFPGQINQQNDNGWTPLHRSVCNGKLSTTSVLLKRGAQCLVTKDGNNPIHFGAQEGHDEIVQRLMKYFPYKIHEQNNNGFTPLHRSVYTGKTSVSKLLIESGTKVNIMDQDGRTPLDVAKQKGYQEIIELFSVKHQSDKSVSKPIKPSMPIIRPTKKKTSQSVKTAVTALTTVTADLTERVITNTKDIESLKLSQGKSVKSLSGLEAEVLTVKEHQENLGLSLTGVGEDVGKVKKNQSNSDQLLHDVVKTVDKVENRLDNTENEVQKNKRQSDQVQQDFGKRIGEVEKEVTELKIRLPTEHKLYSERTGTMVTRAEDLKKQIRSNFVFLTKNVIAKDHLDFLYQKYAITYEDVQHVKHQVTKKEQMSELLYILLEKPANDWVFAFKESLAHESRYVLKIFDSGVGRFSRHHACDN